MAAAVSVMAVGWDWPWALWWLPAAVLPFLIARLFLARPRLVRWAPIDIVATAARRAGLSRRGFSSPLAILRAALVTLAIAAAARPFLFPAAATPAGMAARGAVSPRIALVEPESIPPTPLRLALAALRSVDGFGDAAEPHPAAAARVDLFPAERIADVSAAAPGALVILADGIVPTGTAAAAFARSLQQGAAVLVLVGPDTVEGAARRRLNAWLAELAGISITGKADGAGQRIAVSPALGGFDTAPTGRDAFTTLPGPSVTAHAALDLSPRDTAAVTVLAHTVPEKRPLIVEARVGAGRLCVSALPLSLGGTQAWSDLAAWPVFVPLVDRLVARLAGVAAPPDMPATGARERLSWVPHSQDRSLPARVLLVGAMILAGLDPLLSWLLARRGTATAALPKRSWITWPARAGIVAALGALLWNTGDGPRGTDRPDREIALVIDVSPSMATADAEDGAGAGDGAGARLAAVLAAIADAGDRFAAAPISVFTAAREVTAVGPVGAVAAAGIAPLPAGPRASPLGDATEELLIDGADRYEAIAIASDGMINAGASWAHAARFAADRGIPLVAIPVGGPGTADRPDASLRVVSASLPRLSWRGEEVLVDVELDGPAGLDGVPVALSDRDGRPLARSLARPVATDEVEAGTTRYRGRLPWTPDTDGPQTLLVRPAQDDETGDALADGASATTLVIEQPVRALLLDASPRFEFRFLEQLLATDGRFRVDSCLLDAAARSPAQRASPPARFAAALPETIADWDAYDVVVIGDVQGDAIPGAAAQQLVAAARDDRIGIAWVPGRRWHAATGESSPLDELLPVRPGDAAAPPAFHEARLRWLPAAEASGWLPAAFGEPAMPRGDVAALSAPHRLAPEARLLATATAAGGSPEAAVLLDERGGAVVLAALFETWRLRGATNLDAYAALWRHWLLRLAERRLLAASLRASVSLDPARPAAGESARVVVTPTSPSVDRTGWRVEHLRPDGSRALLDASTGAAAIDDLEAGWHRFVPVFGESDDADATAGLRAAVECLVTQPQEERPGPPAAPAAFVAAAVSSGGGVIPLEAIGSLPQTVARLPLVQGRGRPAWLQGPMATNLLLLALVACCAVDWIDRARRGMP